MQAYNPLLTSQRFFAQAQRSTMNNGGLIHSRLHSNAFSTRPSTLVVLFNQPISTTAINNSSKSVLLNRFTTSVPTSRNGYHHYATHRLPTTTKPSSELSFSSILLSSKRSAQTTKPASHKSMFYTTNSTPKASNAASTSVMGAVESMATSTSTRATSASASVSTTATTRATTQSFSGSPMSLHEKMTRVRFSRDWWVEWTIISAVFGVTGSTSVIVVKKILKDVFEIEGSMMEGPWFPYRISYFCTTLPLYSMILLTVATLAGRRPYFLKVVLRMWGRILPKKVMARFTPPSAVSSSSTSTSSSSSLLK